MAEIKEVIDLCGYTLIGDLPQSFQEEVKKNPVFQRDFLHFDQ